MPEIAWLSDEETLTYLHSTVSTRRQRLRVPEVPMHLDTVLADDPLVGGLTPRLGAAHLKTLTIIGLPSATWPGLLDELNAQGFEYRWCTRAICLDKTDAAEAKLKAVEKIVQGRDFTCIPETLNALEAWLGSRAAIATLAENPSPEPMLATISTRERQSASLPRRGRVDLASRDLAEDGIMFTEPLDQFCR